jgi:hypothetical protein
MGERTSNWLYKPLEGFPGFGANSAPGTLGAVATVGAPPPAPEDKKDGRAP